MPAFLRLRLWLSQGPVRERLLAGIAAGTALALVVLASLSFTTDDDPPGDEVAVLAETGGGRGGTVAAGQTSGDAGAGAVAPGAGATPDSIAQGAGAAPATFAAAASGAPVASGDACAGRASSAPGITADEVRIGVSIVNLAGAVGNAAFNIRPDLAEIAEALTAEINKTGGVACGRKLSIKRYQVNPIEQNDQRAKCLQMVQDRVFVVVDLAGYITPAARGCFIQNKLPFQLSASAGETELRQGYPYLYGMTASSERQVRNGILGLDRRGFFAPPAFQKLGVLVSDCDPPVNDEITASLARVGVRAQQVSTFTLACQEISPPSEILQAVVQHKSAGVTHVFLASSISNSQRYAQLAVQQNFRPRYGLSDYGSNTASVGDWDASFDGALAISSTHNGDLNSGIRNQRVVACDRVLRAHGLDGITTERNDGAAASMCDQFDLFRRAIDRSGVNPTRQSYVEAGVARIGRFDAAIGSDGVFDRAGKVIGGDFRRPLRFGADCRCWKVDGPFEPGF